MSDYYYRENKWDCTSCDTKGILGRHKRCPNCDNPREIEEMDMEMGGDIVTDPEVLKLASQGADWFCDFCQSGNAALNTNCHSCGAKKGSKKPPSKKKSRKSTRSEKPLSARERERRKKIQINTAYLKVPPKEWIPYIVGVGAFFTLVCFIYWATRTHEVTSTVDSISWKHTVTEQLWTQITVRKWRFETRERMETPPINGKGESAGMEFKGRCYREIHHYDKVQCGTEKECTPRYKTETYSCDECSDDGNGFQKCTRKTCSREVRDGETCRDVPKYCDDPVYKDKCDYQTQKWKKNKDFVSRGNSLYTNWKNIQVSSTLGRLRYSADYNVKVNYEDKGKKQTKDISKPTGHDITLGALSDCKREESEFKNWSIGKSVYLKINNLGGISEFSLTPFTKEK